MTEMEWMEKIRVSAEEIKIPKSISPDEMRKKLKKSKTNYARKQITAAVILFVCGISAFAGYQLIGDSREEDIVEKIIMATDRTLIESTGITEEIQDIETVIEPVEKRDAGTIYTVAKDYGEVYDILAENELSLLYSRSADIAKTDAEMEDSSITQSSSLSSAANLTGSMIEDLMGSIEAASDNVNHSETNVQTEGVYESDIIQTDGTYIYVVDNDIVQIIGIQDDLMNIIGQISAPINGASDRILELYINGDCLNLIVEHQKTTLSQSEEDVYYMDTDRTTELLTYDISSRTNPKLSGSIEQDGYYKTSRKIGPVVYLFTQQRIEVPYTARRTAILNDEVKSWIPTVGGNAIASDCIYLPAEGSNGNGLIISSVNVDHPDKVVDNTMILNNYVDIYVSTESLYLYNSDYSDGEAHTEIAKFELNNGVINAVGATSAAGQVYDTFAINENQGKLRLLTTDWSHGENENNLYLFDENMNLTGSLTGIAKGESIYAARYFGNMAYFVTYRNTDPLFVVDLSDEKEPKILSELEITGFSEYLHFWGEDKLIGIGYETDPNTGRQEGIKLTMFDLSNPADLKTLGTCVIGNIDYCPAFYNYKYVLADAGENLLGFAAETYGRSRKDSYLLFSWENGKFQELLVETLADDAGTEGYRGLYAGDTFYLVNQDHVTSYDRTQEYEKKGDLDL